MSRDNNICPRTGENSWECECSGCRSWRSPRRNAAAAAATAAPSPKAIPATAPEPTKAPGDLAEANRLIAAVERIFVATGRYDHEMVAELKRAWDTEAAPVVAAACETWAAWARAKIDEWKALDVREQSGPAKTRVEEARKTLGIAQGIAMRLR